VSTDVSEEHIAFTCFHAGESDVIFSALKMEVMFLRNVGDSQRTTRRYIPEDGTLQTYRANLETAVLTSRIFSAYEA
jgi:hypothetical protein